MVYIVLPEGLTAVDEDVDNTVSNNQPFVAIGMWCLYHGSIASATLKESILIGANREGP